jgi:hypothetical protein
MKIKQIGKTRIGHFTFESQFECNSTFMRFQEFYENPEFRGKVFTHEEFMNWYAKTYGSMSYYTDWAGFNVPTSAIMKVYDLFPNLWDKEKQLVKRVLQTNYQYIIGTQEGHSDTMIHEVAHGLYTTDKEYRDEMMDLINKVPVPIQNKFNKTLLNECYCGEVLEDELQAYMVEGIHDSYDYKFTDKQQEKVNKLSVTFYKVFQKYAYKYEVM